MRPGGACAGPDKGGLAGEALGRLHGGLSTKIHLARDGRGRPLAFAVTGGSVNDCAQFEPVLARIRIKRCGPGPDRPEASLCGEDAGGGGRSGCADSGRHAGPPHSRCQPTPHRRPATPPHWRNPRGHWREQAAPSR